LKKAGSNQKTLETTLRPRKKTSKAARALN